MKKYLVVASLVILASIAAFFFFRQKNDAPKYRTAKIVRGDIVEAVTASGAVNAVTTVQVGTQVSGVIKEINVDFNSQVRKGQIIARIDPAPFQSKVEEARANRLAAEANLEKARASLADAERTLGRSRELFAKNLTPQSSLDTAETAAQMARAQVSVASAGIEQARAALSMAETNMGYTNIVSPVDGIVINRNVDVGQTVAASFQTPTLFTIAQDLTKMQIDSNVAEADIGRVSAGLEVEFTVDAWPGTTFRGEVSQVRNAPITVQNVVSYDVVVKVANPELKLKPGMTANVSVIIAQHGNVLKIPNAALRFRPKDAAKSQPFAAVDQPRGAGVWILSDGKPKRVGVNTGATDGSFTALASGEIAEGAEVIVDALSQGASKDSQNAAARGPRMF
ncbi:MAG: efflux RND transporter periplasmic adaptor subunit [Nitrospirae bacterium]|nr:efflux RND transporter periplasmic adaptor subunit [Nitrospirota bacterium]